MTNTNEPNVRVRVHSAEDLTPMGRINAAMAETVEDIVCDAVEDAFYIAFLGQHPESEGDGDAFREWFKRAKVATAVRPHQFDPVVRAFVGRYLEKPDAG